MIKIGVKRDEVERAPKFTAMLEQATGGLKVVLEAMRFSEDSQIVKFLKEYDAGTQMDRDIMPWEVWAIKAKLNIPQLLGSIIFAMRQQSANTVSVMAISSHPDVVQTQISEAKKPKGHRDRQSLNVSMGFTPTPKGPMFIGKYFAGPESGQKPETPVVPAQNLNVIEEVDVEDIFVDLGTTQRLLSD